MRAIDTNVLARWLLGDDPEQARLATRVMQDSVWIPITVLLELGWLLDKPMGLPRKTVAAMMLQLLNVETAIIEHRQLLRWILDRYLAGADWADMIHLATIENKAELFTTFDKALARKAGQNTPVPIETLGKR